MKAPRKLRSVVFIFALCHFSAPSLGAGIPTVDVASLTQAVTDYLNQLEQYSEILNQGVVQEQDLLQAIEQYEQTLIEYEHMLQQMAALEDALEARDWAELYGMYEDIINSFPSSEPDYSDPEWQEANEQVGKVFHRGSELDDIEMKIQGLPYDADSEARLLATTRAGHGRNQFATSQHLFVERSMDELEINAQRIADVEADRMALGPEDHLATLQLIASQNALVIETLQQQSLINTARFKHANQLDSYFFSAQKEARDARIRQLEAQMGEPIVINEEPLVQF